MIEEEYVFDGPAGAVTLNGELLDSHSDHEDENVFDEPIYNAIIPEGALIAFSEKYDVVRMHDYGRERIVHYKQKLGRNERLIIRLQHLSGRIEEIESDLADLHHEVSTLVELISTVLRDEELSQ